MIFLILCDAKIFGSILALDNKRLTAFMSLNEIAKYNAVILKYLNQNMIIIRIIKHDKITKVWNFIKKNVLEYNEIDLDLWNAINKWQ